MAESDKPQIAKLNKRKNNSVKDSLKNSTIRIRKEERSMIDDFQV